jgi:putative ABC transport system substrate-binding protein
MTNKLVGLALCAVLLALCSLASAQQPKKIFRIGYLGSLNPARESVRGEAIRLALHELGYIDGQNIVIEYRYAEGKVDQGPKLVAELVAHNCDVILVAGGYSWIQGAMNATKTTLSL